MTEIEKIKVADYIKSQSEFNKWLKELTETELNHLAEMLIEFSALRHSLAQGGEEKQGKKTGFKVQLSSGIIIVNAKSVPEACDKLEAEGIKNFRILHGEEFVII